MANDPSCPGPMTDLDYSLGWILLVGTWVSYFPQHLKLYRQKTHVGLSFQNFAGAQMVSHLVFLEFFLSSYRSTFECCSDVSFRECSAAYLAGLQLFLADICQHVIIALYLWFYNKEYDHATEAALNMPRGQIYRTTIKHFLILISLEVIASILVPALALPLGLDHDAVQGYAVGLSATAGLTLCYHWCPQIYETYKLRQLGSLSMFMLVLQSTGCILTAYNLSSHGGWTVWTPLLVAGFMQYCLMGLIIYLHFTDRKNKDIGGINDREKLIGGYDSEVLFSKDGTNSNSEVESQTLPHSEGDGSQTSRVN